MTKSHRRPLRRTHLELRLRVPEIPITHARTVHLRTDLLADGCSTRQMQIMGKIDLKQDHSLPTRETCTFASHPTIWVDFHSFPGRRAVLDAMWSLSTETPCLHSDHVLVTRPCKSIILISHSHFLSALHIYRDVFPHEQRIYTITKQ